MVIPPLPHAWNLKAPEAIALQKTLAGQLSTQTPNVDFRNIAGLDAAFSRDGRFCIGAVVVWDIASGSIIEKHGAKAELQMPYIPGLLTFREAPALLAALTKLKTAPDALLCDGQGIAHPRRLGIAAHLGLLCDLPSIGCAKSRLTGSYEMPAEHRGSSSPLIDKGERIGTVLRTRDRVKPIFVSVGHKMDLASAERIVLQCLRGLRLPEPTRLADKYVAELKGTL